MIYNKFGKPMEEETGFDKWFYEQESYGLRAERFYDLLDQIKATNAQTPMPSKSVVEWLKAAYEQGKEDSEANDIVKFIARDYVELSHDKVLWQRNDYIKRCQKFLDEYRGVEE